MRVLRGIGAFGAISRTFMVGGAAVLSAVIFTAVLWVFKPALVWNWFIALAATLISVVFAVVLFWYQREKNDQGRQEQLLVSLAAEARACLRMLEEPPAEITALNNKELGTAVLVPLPTTVLDEAVRSGLHHPSDTFGLVLLAGYLHAHNSDVQAVMSIQATKVELKILRSIIERLKWRQDQVARNCRGLIDRIEALGLPEPSVRYSKKPEA